MYFRYTKHTHTHTAFRRAATALFEYTDCHTKRMNSWTYILEPAHTYDIDRAINDIDDLDVCVEAFIVDQGYVKLVLDPPLCEDEEQVRLRDNVESVFDAHKLEWNVVVDRH